MITFDGSTEIVPAYDRDTTYSLTDETGSNSAKHMENENETRKPSSNNGGAIVVAEKRPEVLGVVVIAEGAENILVKMQLIDAAQMALNVPVSKIGVYAMK